MTLLGLGLSRLASYNVECLISFHFQHSKRTFCMLSIVFRKNMYFRHSNGIASILDMSGHVSPISETKYPICQNRITSNFCHFPEFPLPRSRTFYIVYLTFCILYLVEIGLYKVPNESMDWFDRFQKLMGDGQIKTKDMGMFYIY